MPFSSILSGSFASAGGGLVVRFGEGKQGSYDSRGGLLYSGHDGSREGV